MRSASSREIGKLSTIYNSCWCPLARRILEKGQGRTSMILSKISTGSRRNTGTSWRISWAHQSRCWHGTIAVDMMRRFGSTRWTTKSLQWPGLERSSRLKGLIFVWKTCGLLACHHRSRLGLAENGPLHWENSWHAHLVCRLFRALAPQALGPWSRTHLRCLWSF